MEIVLTWLGRWGRAVLAHPVAFLMTLSLGGVVSFGYSYIPLHGTKQLRVERLESELGSQSARNLELAARLAKLEVSGAEAGAEDEFLRLRGAHAKASARVGELEKELKGVRRELKRAERARAASARTVSALEEELDAVAAREASPPERESGFMAALQSSANSSARPSPGFFGQPSPPPAERERWAAGWPPSDAATRAQMTADAFPPDAEATAPPANVE